MANEGMKAVQYSPSSAGPAGLKRVSIPVPVPKEGEFLVKVEGASMNPLDWKTNEGLFGPREPAKIPYIPGIEIAGEVVSVGTGVTNFAPGDKVISSLDMKNGGSLAEYAIALPKFSAKRPPEITADNGACLVAIGVTALQCLTNSGVNIDGSYTGNVLITEAAGGVGLYAVQLAKLSGAHVTVTVGERNLKLLKGLGADEVLDCKTEEGRKLTSPSGKKYDVVVNCANIKWATIQPQLSATGTVQELIPSPSSVVTSLWKKLTQGKQKRLNFVRSVNSKDLTFLVDLIVEGKLKTFVDSKFPIEKEEDGSTRSKDGNSSGKVVV